jgi:AAR2 protein
MNNFTADNDSKPNHADDNCDEGLIVLLDLPKHSLLGLDGQTLVLQRDDFIGVRNVPSRMFHLVTASAAGHTTSTHHSLTVGFVVVTRTTSSQPPKDPFLLIRRYNPQTEEVSEDSVDHLTIENLMKQIRGQQIDPSRLLHYDQVMPTSSQGDGEDQGTRSSWQAQTCFINESDILNLRGLSNGDKIVPGSYDPEDDLAKANSTTMAATSSATTVDGKSIEYPSIPVINTQLSLATHKHSGTRQFLAKLPPDQRTKLFVLDAQEMQDFLLDHVLQHYYQGSWQALLGDVQLGFCLFLYLHCLASLEHWKDLVAMLALSTDHIVARRKHADLFRGLLTLLPYQLSSMDAGFLEDMEEAGGNFLLPSLELLHRNLCLHDLVDNETANRFQHVLVSKFPQTFTESSLRIQMLPNGAGEGDVEMEDDDYHDDDNDEDGPVMVDASEIEASLARSAAAGSSTTPSHNNAISSEIQQTYPLLVAAIQPHEDILMTCARALDEKSDVGLVREAAAYLEEVEQYK